MTFRLKNDDELLWTIERGLKSGRLRGWSQDFGRSVLRQSRRRGWEPSARQRAVMRQLADELVGPLGNDDEDDGEVVLLDDRAEN